MQMKWSSKIDVSGNIMSLQTNFQIINNTDLTQNEDFESKRLRFWKIQASGLTPMPHSLTYGVWKESMTVRYYFELALFLAAAIVFTYFISEFNTSWHQAHKDIKILELMRHEYKGYKGKDEKLIESMKERIKEEEKHAGIDIEKAFEGLNETMFIAFFALTFPLQIFLNILYARLTKRIFTIRSVQILDVSIFICVILWFLQFEIFSIEENDGWELSEPPHKAHVFMKNVEEDKKKPGGFQFDYLLAFTAFLFWLRAMLMLVLTRAFGPLLNVIVAMTKDMATFFALWSI